LKQKIKWLDRRVARPGPFLALCLTEAEYLQVMKELKVNYFNQWVSERADATTHHLINKDGAISSVICLEGYKDRSPIEVAGMLVHEAVHVWQWYTETIGERTPASEQEAYAIQAIAQELMAEFARRMKDE
jgi:hypothetical protein